MKLVLLVVACLFFGDAWAKSELKPVLMGVGINVEDLERAEKFYSEVFNLRRPFQYPPTGGPVIEVGLGNPDGEGAQVILARFNDDPLPEAKSSYGRFVFRVKDADAIAKRAETRGSTLREVGLPRGPGKPIIIFFDDPDGYDVELYQAP